MKFATLALVAGASAFPSFDSFHAHCALTFDVQGSCADAYTAMDNMVKTNADPASPKGTYSAKQETAGKYLWSQRKTANGKYIDDVDFTFADSNGNCKVSARSRSETLSYYDYNVNFCNMYNVARGAKVQFSNVQHSNCAWVPDDVTTTCNRY